MYELQSPRMRAAIGAGWVLGLGARAAQSLYEATVRSTRQTREEERESRED